MANKKFEPTTQGVVPKILVISDYDESGTRWSLSLRRNHFGVVQQNDLDDAIEVAEIELPDMILIDSQNFDISVLDLIRKLRELTTSPILLLTSAISEDQIVETYMKGVDDCVIKPVGPTHMVAKVRAWLRRTWTSRVDALEEIRVSNFLLNLSQRTLILENQSPVRLTNLELRLLHLLMSHSPRAVSYDQIIQRVWGNSSDSDYAALKNVVYRLRLKIEANPNHPRYLVTHPGVGYKFESVQE